MAIIPPVDMVVVNQFGYRPNGQWVVTTQAVIPGELDTSFEAVHRTGVSHIVDLVASVVPATAVAQGGRAYSPGGVAYVTSEARNNADQFLGGIAVRNDGSMRITIVDPAASDEFLGPMAVSSNGVARVVVV